MIFINLMLVMISFDPCFYSLQQSFLLYLELKPKNGFKMKTGFDQRRYGFGFNVDSIIYIKHIILMIVI